MIRRLIPYWQTARKETVAGGALLVFGACVDLLQPWPIKWLVDYVFGKQTPPGWLARLWPAIATGDAAAGITAVCISILLLAIIHVGSSRVDLQACKLEYSIVSPK